MTTFLFASGCKDRERGLLLKEIMQTPYFRIVVVDDEETVELCGALKVCTHRFILLPCKQCEECITGKVIIKCSA